MVSVGGNRKGVTTGGNLGLFWALITELSYCLGDGSGW